MPAGISIPAKGHYLFTNSAAQPALLALADQTFGTGFTDDGGAAVTMPDGTIVDQVGLSAGSAYGEGTPLVGLTANANQSYERRAGGANGSSVDTNDNAADFQLVTPSAPQNLTSVITPALTVSPPTIDFGSIVRGTTANVDVNIANNAGTAVTLTTPFAVSGADAGEFTAATPALATVAAGATTTTPVTFQPAATGSKSATLTIASANGETHLITLTGVSVCPAIVVSASLPNIEAGVFLLADDLREWRHRALHVHDRQRRVAGRVLAVVQRRCLGHDERDRAVHVLGQRGRERRWRGWRLQRHGNRHAGCGGFNRAGDRLRRGRRPVARQ